jgi:hypothetical protein
VFYVVFTAARFFHTLFYFLAIGKARTGCWIVGVLATLAVALDLLVQVFTMH